MTDSASDIVVSRLLKKIDAATMPGEISALSAEFARNKPPASPALGDDYLSAEKQVIAKILAQENKMDALYDLAQLANLGAASPEDTMANRHSLAVPAAQAWNTLLQTVPDNHTRTLTAIETMTFAKNPVLKDVAASALLTCLSEARVMDAFAVFGLSEVQHYAVESGNSLLKMQVDDFHHARARAALSSAGAAPAAPART